MTWHNYVSASESRVVKIKLVSLGKVGGCEGVAEEQWSMSQQRTIAQTSSLGAEFVSSNHSSFLF
jgi:uncharacterized membrane protein